MVEQKPMIHQSQEMRLKLSQQNILALSMLAQTSLELKESLQEILETNPALEVRDEPWVDSLEKLQENSYEESLHDPEVPNDISEALNLEIPPEEPFNDFYPKLSPRETTNSDLTYYDTQSATDLGEPGYSDSVQTIIERTLSTSEDLRDHLKEQLVWVKADDSVKELAGRLIENLDSNGFHIVNPEQLLPPDASPELLQEAMDIVRGLEPVGTCTRDWQESLLVQMEKLGGFSDEAIELIRNHPDLLLNPNVRQIARILNVDIEEVQGILEEIKTLNPFPGKEYGKETAPNIYPDLFVEERDGEFYVAMNDEIIPVVNLNQEFLKEAGSHDLDEEGRSFVRKKIKEANEFLQRLHFRQSTLLKVGHAICRRQTEFLKKGQAFLKPLILSEIAQEIGVHPSTVSRATSGKYIQTKWGILELKDFFGRQTGAGDHSKESIKVRVSEIIENLKKSGQRITDRKIQLKLEELGIKVALRTVNKYRREIQNENN